MAFKHRISFATDLVANFGFNRFRIIPESPDIVSKHLRAAIWSCCAVWFKSEQMPFPQTGRISFATDWAANFGCNRFRITHDIVFKLLRAAIWSCCVVQLEFEQTPFPRTGRRLRSAAWNIIRLGTCGFDPMSYCFTQRPMTDRKIERSDGRCFGRQQLLADSIEISFHMNRKSDSSRPDIYKALKLFLTVEVSQYRKIGSIFSSSEPVDARSDCSRLGNPLCLCSPVRPAKAVPEHCPKSLAPRAIFAVKSFDCLLK